MKLLSFISLIIIFLGCAKENTNALKSDGPEVSEKSSSFEGLMKFEMREYTYDGETHEFTTYSAFQREEPVKIYRASLYYDETQFVEIVDDSILLHIPINFDIVSPDSTYIQSLFLSFDYWEDLNKLVPISENEYSYMSKEQFFESLALQGLKQGLYKSRTSMFDFGFADNLSDYYFGVNRIFDWYFEDEKLEITHMEWNQKDELIQLTGTFGAYLKMPSCGWWITHDVRNAHFAIKM